MAGSVSKTILLGNLGKDPEVRNTQEGKKVVNLSLATSETWNDKASGERKERTEWHRVVIFDERHGEFAANYLKKGMKVYLEGKNQTRKWTDPSGVEKYTTEVVIAQFQGTLQALEAVGHGDGGNQQGQQRQGGDRQDSYGGNGGGRGSGGGGRDTRPGMGGGGYSRGNGGGGGGGRGPAGPSWGDPAAGGGGGGPSWDAPKGGDLDDEIPFVRSDEMYIGAKMNKGVI